MPEGHVIHRLANELKADFSARPVSVSSPQGRFSSEAARLDGTVLTGAEAIGKHLFISFDVPEPALIHIHLGLIGGLNFEPLAPPRGQVRLRIANDELAADLRGPQWCRAVTWQQRDATYEASGPDPLRPEADPAVGLERVNRSTKPIAALLMDQKIAAGVGNIYRAEVLFRQRLSPEIPGKSVTAGQWELIWDDLVGLMNIGVADGEINTVLPGHSPEAQQRPPRVDAHGGQVYVYRRAGEPCLVCGTTVLTKVLAGRNLYWCPNCQRGSARG